MITVSNDYLEQLNRNFRKTQAMRVVFGFVDVTAFVDNTITTNGETRFSNVEDIENDDNLATANYVTLEKHRWLLDGTIKIAPVVEPFAKQGFVSNAISDDNGEFTENPKITMEFANTHNSIGFSFMFDNISKEYPSEMKITTYLDGVVVTEKTFTINNNEFVLESLFPTHNKIEFEFVKTVVPHRRIRLVNLKYGIVKVYNTENFMQSSKMYKEVHPLSLELSISNFDFTLDNNEHLYNHDNPEGIVAYLQENQLITVSYRSIVG